MNITRNAIDDLNSVITVTIEQSDIQEPVEKTLSDYRKKAHIPGFRKGMVPMNYIKKQYEEAIKFDEINKILQKSVQDFIQKENLIILGQPLPQPKENLDLNAPTLDFNFEIGLSPDVQVDLSKIKVPLYQIEASDKDVEETLERMQKQYGKKIEVEKVKEDSFMSVTVKSEDLLKDAVLWVDRLKEPKKFIGKKVGDTIKIKAQNLYSDPHDLQYGLNLSHEEAHHFNEELEITLKEINAIEPAELNEEFFQKAFPGSDIKTQEEAVARLKQETQAYYDKEADNQFLNDVTDQLLDKTNFNLPKSFLVKFIQNSQEKEMSDEEAEKEYEKSEKPLRYQLIEGKILSDNEVKVQPEDLMNKAKEDIKEKLASYGYQNTSEEEINQYAAQMLQNQEQIRQISDLILKDKLIEIYKKQVKITPKKVSFKEFASIVNPEKSK